MTGSQAFTDQGAAFDNVLQEIEDCRQDVHGILLTDLEYYSLTSYWSNSQLEIKVRAG
jgi:hypothetical protein